MNCHVIDEATTGVVAVVRPELTWTETAGMRPTRTQTPVFADLNEGRGLSFAPQAATSPLDRKAVITQDPYRSDQQFWSHPPV